MSFPLPSTSTPKSIVVLFGGAVQLQVYLLERGVGHLALSETVIQTPGVFRLHEDEQLVAVPFGERKLPRVCGSSLMRVRVCSNCLSSRSSMSSVMTGL